jgi:hypothetical protein
VVEDAHWAVAATLGVLPLLARRLQEAKVIISRFSIDRALEGAGRFGNQAS